MIRSIRLARLCIDLSTIPGDRFELMAAQRAITVAKLGIGEIRCLYLKEKVTLHGQPCRYYCILNLIRELSYPPVYDFDMTIISVPRLALVWSTRSQVQFSPGLALFVRACDVVCAPTKKIHRAASLVNNSGLTASKSSKPQRYRTIPFDSQVHQTCFSWVSYCTGV